MNIIRSLRGMIIACAAVLVTSIAVHANTINLVFTGVSAGSSAGQSTWHYDVKLSSGSTLDEQISPNQGVEVFDVFGFITGTAAFTNTDFSVTEQLLTSGDPIADPVIALGDSATAWNIALAYNPATPSTTITGPQTLGQLTFETTAVKGSIQTKVSSNDVNDTGMGLGPQATGSSAFLPSANGLQVVTPLPQSAVAGMSLIALIGGLRATSRRRRGMAI